MKNALSRCPVCGGDLIVTHLRCESCETSIEGRFINGAFAGLTPEQLDFVEAFVRCEGRINRLVEEKTWGSYPTIRNKLHEVIRALGFEPGKEDGSDLPDERRRMVLEELDTGKISAEEAMRLLSGQKESP